MAAVMPAVLRRDQARSMVGAGLGRDVTIRGIRRLLRPRYRAVILTVIRGVVGLRYAEELLRCTRRK